MSQPSTISSMDCGMLWAFCRVIELCHVIQTTFCHISCLDSMVCLCLVARWRARTGQRGSRDRRDREHTASRAHSSKYRPGPCDAHRLAAWQAPESGPSEGATHSTSAHTNLSDWLSQGGGHAAPRFSF